MRLPVPKGTLIPIGGGEDKKERKVVLGRVIAESAKKNPSVCVVTVATTLPREVASEYRAAFKTLGVKRITSLYYRVRSEADKEIHLQKVRGCDILFFAGGDQLKLSSLLGGTKLMRVIRTRYFDEEHFVVAGTSAGAAAMSDTMIIAGSGRDALVKGELELTNGLDLINSVFIDTHFTNRGRFGRLIQTVTCNPGVLGLGLGEDTGVVIYRGNEMEVVGSGLVVIADGSEITYTDLTEIKNGSPITVEGIRMHILGSGRRFLINEGKVVIPPISKLRKKRK